MSEIDVVFEGYGVTPGALDARRVMPVILAYVESICAAGAVETGGDDAPFTVAITEVKSGSARFGLARVVQDTDPDDAEDQFAHAVERVPVYLARSGDIPQRLRAPIGRLRKALAAVPDEVSVSAARGAKLDALTAAVRRPPPDEMKGPEAFRARVMRVGGKRPRVQVVAEGQLVSLEASPELAVRAGSFLYQEVEIEAEVVRAASPSAFPILSGEMTRIDPLDQRDPVEAWDAWYRAAGRPWSSVDDIEAELQGDG